MMNKIFQISNELVNDFTCHDCHDCHDYRDVEILIDFWASGSLSFADVLTLIAGYSIDLVCLENDPAFRYVKNLCCCDNDAFSARYFHSCEFLYFYLKKKKMKKRDEIN